MPATATTPGSVPEVPIWQRWASDERQPVRVLKEPTKRKAKP